MKPAGSTARSLVRGWRAPGPSTRVETSAQELASRYAAPLTIWPLVALLCLALNFPLTRVAEYLERRWRPVTRA